MSRFVRLLTLVIIGALFSAMATANPILNESPMESGLWNMTIVGTIQVPSANVNEPIHQSTQLCIKPNESPSAPFLPANHGQCTTTNTPLANGHEQWNIHCTVPGATVHQVGWIQGLPQSFEAHWRITDHISGPARYKTETTMQMKGYRVGPSCGSVR